MGKIKILKASAGSGKTYRLAYEYIRNVIASPGSYRHILAVTFTNKATEEMKQRIVSELNALAEGRGGYLALLEKELDLAPETIRNRAVEARTKILHDYSRFTVVTIDKFFQRIIRSFIKELGIDIHYNLELQTDTLLESATDRMIDEIAVNRRLRDWVIRFAEEKIERNGQWDIRSEISKLGQELFKEQYRTVAGDSPSGEELVRIVGELVGKSRAAEASMRQTASEALSLIASAGVSVDDFAYGKQGCMGYFVKTAAGLTEPYGKRVCDALSSDAKWVPARSPRKGEIAALVPALRPLLEKLCSIYDSNVRLMTTARLVQENYRSFALLNDLSDKVAEICTEQNLVPISETNAILHRLIGDNDTPFIYEKAGNVFSRFMIDEFQDTSMQQWENFVPLLENAVAQAEDSPVLLVGDVKQSIYRWRGGDWRILGHRVGERFGAPEEATLETNYRSLKTVVEFNNRIVGACVGTDSARMDARMEEACEQGLLSQEVLHSLRGMLATAYRHHEQRCHKESSGGHVRICEYDPKTQSETELAIRAIEELQQRGYEAGDIAVLVRTNPQGSAVAQALLDRKAACPDAPYRYDVVTQEALQIGNSDAASFIAAVLRLASEGDDSVKRAVYNRYLGEPMERPLSGEEKDFVGRLCLLSIEEAFEEILLRYRLNEQAQEVAYLQAMQEQIHAFSTSKIADIPLFLKWWDETGRSQSISLPRTRNAITVITVHKAKGLQYKAVVLPYCNWSLAPKTGNLTWVRSRQEPFDRLGTVPVNWGNALARSAFAEDSFKETVLSHIDNINLFYVAVTRAEEELHIVVPRVGKSASSRINELIVGALETGPDDTVALGDMTGTVRETDQGRIFDFGTPLSPAVRQADAPTAPTPYPSRKIGARLRFRLGSQRYFPQEDEGEAPAPVLSPRNHGIIMHKLLENIADRTQIGPQLRQMRDSGQISEPEAENVRKKLEAALDDPTVASWFDPRWTVVRNENDIIVPGQSGIRRPDRVLLKGTEAVVIDYKFGLRKTNRHVRQVGEYMDLLRQMGYRTVRGFLWYVERDEIQAVTD